MVQTMDEMFGQVMAAVERVGQDLEDWLIVYCSDHGEMLGQHGVWEKQCFYEGSVRVPLMIRPPRSMREAWGCAGHDVQENVNLCDLFATLCDLSGLEMPVSGRGFDSRSLVPLMKGDASDWHHCYHNETVSQCHDDWVMIKRDALKYQWYGQDLPEVLFDLQHDPGESVNVINDARHAAAVRVFRSRRDALGFGPQADPDYRNAGYLPAGYSPAGKMVSGAK
jgi:choline-sulfatase